MNQNSHFNAGPSAGGFGQQPAGGGFGQQAAAGGFGQQPPMAGGFGNPPAGQAAQGFGSPMGQPMGGYGAPGGAPLKNSTMALVSLVAGLLSLMPCCAFLGSIVAIITGVMGKKEINARPDELKGSGMATAGIILGAVSIVLYLIGTIVGVISGISIPEMTPPTLP